MSDLPEGWLSEKEANRLVELARDRLVLEVGAYLGRSTVAMARTARHVVSVDHHRGSPEHQAGKAFHDPRFVDPDSGVFTTYPAFVANLRERGLTDKVSVFVASSRLALRLLAPCFDVAFIDGAHDFHAAVEDGKLARALLVPGGLIAFHDFGLQPVAMAAAITAAGRDIEQCESLAVIRT